MKKLLALVLLVVASVFCRGAVAGPEASASVQQMEQYRLVSVFAAPGTPYEVRTWDSSGGFVPAGVGMVGSSGIGRTSIPAATCLPPPGMASVIVGLRNPDGSITFIAATQDDGWWLE